MNIDWIAGLFEGEGCIYFPSDSNTVTLALTMCDEDVVAHFHEEVGFGQIHIRRREFPDRDAFEWKGSHVLDVQPLLVAMYPLMGARRRAKIDEALERLSRVRVQSRNGTVGCGTLTGFGRHKRNGETPCRACKDAKNAYMREYLRGR